MLAARCGYFALRSVSHVSALALADRRRHDHQPHHQSAGDKIPQTGDGVRRSRDPRRVRPLAGVLRRSDRGTGASRRADRDDLGDVLAVLNFSDQQQQSQQVVAGLAEPRASMESAESPGEIPTGAGRENRRSARGAGVAADHPQIEHVVSELELAATTITRSSGRNCSRAARRRRGSTRLKARLRACCGWPRKRLISGSPSSRPSPPGLIASLQRRDLDEARPDRAGLEKRRDATAALAAAAGSPKLRIRREQLDVRAVQVEQEICQSQATQRTSCWSRKRRSASWRG